MKATTCKPSKRRKEFSAPRKPGMSAGEMWDTGLSYGDSYGASWNLLGFLETFACWVTSLLGLELCSVGHLVFTNAFRSFQNRDRIVSKLRFGDGREEGSNFEVAWVWGCEEFWPCGDLANCDPVPRSRTERTSIHVTMLRILQNLSTMLEEAVQYVKFLQLQIKMLSSDELWMYAPIAYNGMGIGLDDLHLTRQR
ncbi:bHLH139 protein [Hibiscus syriacus]|uniref:BHLH139 protein n=1 Tax=Hibiscus syriacus TaxID=106335 RepID=A0A6A3AX50_HIBSY|nr:bHLH139 protein [Hibiscus syriacus]